MSLPSDPILLLSVINTLLRDQYASLDQLCEDKGLSRQELITRLATAGYQYVPACNQFR